MHVEYRSFYSSRLGREMEFKIYGHAGKPMVVFPSSGGRFYEYEDFNMIEACKPFIHLARRPLLLKVGDESLPILSCNVLKLPVK